MTSPLLRNRFFLSGLALLAAASISGATVLLGSGSTSHGARAAKLHAQTSPIWHVGTKWSVTTTQNSASIMADQADGLVQRTVWDFRVEQAPTSAKGAWVVRATTEGAEGPMADGFRLMYVRNAAGGFDLHQLAFVGQQPVDTRYARMLVGQDFPLQLHVSATPTSRTIKN